MAQHKTLVAYESKQGASKETAEILAKTLQSKFGLDVDLVNLKKEDVADLAQYGNVVVGAGVRGGRIYGNALKLLKSDLGGKRVAFFTSSSWGGTPGSYENAKGRFVVKTLAKYPEVNFVGSEAFGGRIRYFGKLMLDNTNPAKVEAWAEELGKKFTE
ncbi:MAG: flavodoxin domain-containing protein [Candidatus Bathyarchaeia archaeon]|jgi:menaquinone-dependent protoporphyrinogen IX oxidase